MATIKTSGLGKMLQNDHKTDAQAMGIYRKHRKRLKVLSSIKMVHNVHPADHRTTADHKTLSCIRVDTSHQMKLNKSLNSEKISENQSQYLLYCCDVFKPTNENSLRAGRVFSSKHNCTKPQHQCLRLCDRTFPVNRFQLSNHRTLPRCMSIIFTCILHALSSRWSTVGAISSFFCADTAAAKTTRFLSNHHRSSTSRTLISVNHCLMIALLLPLLLVFASVPGDTSEQRLSLFMFAHAAKSIQAQTPSHPFLDAIHRRPLVARNAGPLLPVPAPLTTTGAPNHRRSSLRLRRPHSGPDLQPSDSVHYETYQNAQSSPTTLPTLIMPENLDLSHYESTVNQTLELSRPSRPVIKTFPTGDQNQLYCDLNMADLDKSPADSVSDSLIQQRIIVESEQLELFLRLKPFRSVNSAENNLPDRFMDDFRLHTTTMAPVVDELEQQRRRRVQCQDMLQSQLEKDLDQKRRTPKRPLLELSTSTFNVSCHVVEGPQFQCALFTFNMHHFGSIFRSNKEPHCSFTFVRFNLIDSRCQLSLIMKRIDPFKIGQPKPSASRSHKSSRNSKLPLPVTSAIWDLFQEIPPIMYSFSDLNDTINPTTSPLSFDMPYTTSNLGDQCATMCQKVFDDGSSSGKYASNHQIRKQFNPNELIIIENAKPKCLMQFDQSFARAKLKSKNSKASAGPSGPGNSNSNSGSSSSLLSMSSSGGTNNAQASNSNDNKKICVESSRHILTHNGLVIKHPTLRIVPIPMPGIRDIVEGQTLAPLEFYLKLDSKNMSSNAQYFDLVLKKYKWSASATLLYPDIYPGILTGVTTVSVQSIHHHQNLQFPDLASNAYFRFVFNNLKITKWGYRYLLKISLRSNPTCYTIETTYGPFDVGARPPQLQNPKTDKNSSNSNELRFVWTTSKCHTVKMDLQASVVMDRGSSTSTSALVPFIPTSRFIDYLCDLNIEKLSTFLINFLANRASSSSGDLLPAQLRLPSSGSSGSLKSKLKKQFSVKRDFSFSDENDYTKLVSNFIQQNRLSINGSQCLEMSLQSNNFSLIETTSSSNHSSIISDMFQSYYQLFHSYHKQQLNQRLINMTFIYSSELLLKIKQVFLDDEPLYKPPPPPPTQPPTKPPLKSAKPHKATSKPSNRSKISNNNRNVGKRKTGNSASSDAEVDDEEEEEELPEEPVRTSPAPPTATLASKPIDRSRKINGNGKPEVLSPKGPDSSGNRSRSRGAQGKATPATRTTPKLVFGSRKDKTKTTTPSTEAESDAAEAESNALTGRPLLWIGILLANTLLVFGFIILFAICYYKKMLADEKTARKSSSTNAAANRKPLKRFVQPDEKIGPSSAADSPPDVKPLKDDIFMLEKTDYSSGGSTHEDLASHDMLQHRRQSQFQRNGRGPSLGDTEHVPAMKSSAQRVQQMNRVITRRTPSMPPEVETFQQQAPRDVENGEQTHDLNRSQSPASAKSGRFSSPLVKISIDDIEDSKDSGNEEEEEEAEPAEDDEDPAVETALPIIVEEDAEDAASHTSWLPLPGSMPPEEDSSPSHSPKTSPRRSVSFLHPNTSLINAPIDEEDEEAADSPDLNYSLQGDRDEERKYYIYKVRDVNMVPKKECVGRVVVPVGTGKNRNTVGGVTLEELRKLIRHSDDEALQDAAKQRFRYLSESYHLVALDEAYTPVDQLYPTQGVFIKLDNEHPFTKPRIDTSLTARLQAEYERRFGPIAPRRPRKSSIKLTGRDMLSQEAQNDDSKSIYDDPIPFTSSSTSSVFNSQAIREQFEKQQRVGKRTRHKSLSSSNFRYDSMDYVDGQFRDAKKFAASKESANTWNPKAHQAWIHDPKGSKEQRQRYARGQRPPWKF